MNKSERLIVALDYPLVNVSILDFLEAGVTWFKLRPRFFQYYQAFEHFKILQAHANLMYDGKLQDTPDSIRGDVQHAFELGFRYVTVKTEINGVGEAVHVPRSSEQHILVVGNLTSLPFEANNVDGYLAVIEHGVDARVGGAVVPGCDLRHLRRKYPKAILISPGIRMVGEQANDHEPEFGTMHPTDAIKAGASQVVVGRPITLAADPIAAAKRYLETVTNV